MKQFQDSIREIIADNTSGSSAILDKTLQALLELTEKQKSIDPGLLKNELLELFHRHGNFAILFHFLNELFIQLEKNTIPEELHNLLKRYKNNWSDSTHKAAGHFIKFIGSKIPRAILLHSNSATIHALCRQLAEKGSFPKIYQTLSGPANEGKVQATMAMMKKFEIVMFHESDAARYLPEVDYAVFGADLISEEFFINKTGTYPLSLLCGEFKKPVYVLADSRKVISENSVPENIFKKLTEENPKDPDEIWEDPPKNVKPLNYYFEPVPNQLVNAFIGEEGALKTESPQRPAKIANIFPGGFSG